MIEAVFANGVDEITVHGLTQWDIGQKLKITADSLPETYQVHFGYKRSEIAYVVESAYGVVGIPNLILQQPTDAVAWIYVSADGGKETVKTIHLPIQARQRPSDYIYTEDEWIDYQRVISKVENAVENANNFLDVKANALKTTATGNPAVMYPDEDSVLKPMIHLEPIQAGSGDPYPAGGGKNLLPYPYKNTTITTNGITFTDNGDGTVTINGTSTGTAYFNFYTAGYDFGDDNMTIPANATNGTYTFSILDVGMGGLNLRYDGTNKKCFISINSGYTFNNVTIYPMIEEGTVKTDWEPYSNIRHITGRTGVTLHRTNKNLVDVPSVTVEGDHPWANDYRDILLPPGTYTMRSYAMQAGTITHVCMSVRTLSDPTNQIAAKSIDYANGDLIVAFTIPDDEKGVRVYFYSNLTADVISTECTFHNIVVEMGSKYTGHEYYQGDIYTVDFGQTVYSGLFDWNGCFLTADAYMELNGSEGWTRRLSSSIGEYIFECSSGNPALRAVMSNYGNVGGLDRGTNYINILTDGRVQARFDHIATVEEFTAMLAETPLQLIYTPANGQNASDVFAAQILSLDGLNVIHTDGDELTVQYNKSIVYALEEALNRIAALEAAIVNNV